MINKLDYKYVVIGIITTFIVGFPFFEILDLIGSSAHKGLNATGTIVYNICWILIFCSFVYFAISLIKFRKPKERLLSYLIGILLVVIPIIIYVLVSFVNVNLLVSV